MIVNPAELYYEAGKDTILYQSTVLREFSDRFYSLLNLGVGTLVAGGFIFNVRLGSLEWTLPVLVLGLVALAGFLVVAVLCLWRMPTPEWYAYPDLAQMADRARGAPLNGGVGAQLQLVMAENLTEAAQLNQKVLDGKSAAMSWVLLALALEIVSTIALVVLIFSGSYKAPAGGAQALLV